MTEKTPDLKSVEQVVIRFAGDSGDGMQLTGNRFTDTTAILGNDLSTLPDFPAEIRAPAGSLAGVSAFQIQFGSHVIHTPGDQPDVLVAMNPAALQLHLKDVLPGGIIVINSDAFTKRNMGLAGMEENPLEKEENQKKYTIYPIGMNQMVLTACEDMDIPKKTVERSKNLFALGFLFWLYDRPLNTTEAWLKEKFKKMPSLVEANTRALNAGYNYGGTIEAVSSRYIVKKASLPAGKYRNVIGNYATTLGLVAASEKSGLPLFFGGYPITPATDILQELSALKNFNVKTFQAEDEIAGVASTIGAAFAGDLAVTATSGPGVALKTEAMGLAIMAELPMVVINVQRGGPSTGLPTKTEQADLLQAMYGRNGEAPIAIIAAQTPGDCFYTAYEACMIALKYMMPVMVLTDGYLANGSEPWLIPKMKDLPAINVEFAKPRKDDDEPYKPYLREDKTLSRPWAIPGTPGLEHRIGGLEKQNITGNVNYDPDNHHNMIVLREQKVKNVVQDIPPQEIFGAQEGDLLILSWGSVYGACLAAAESMQDGDAKVGHAHLRWLNPFPENLGDILSRFKHILIPEVNMGQLVKIIRSTYLVDAKGLNIVRGRPLRKKDIVKYANELLGSKS